jgi:hypothetical protein
VRKTLETAENAEIAEMDRSSRELGKSTEEGKKSKIHRSLMQRWKKEEV